MSERVVVPDTNALVAMLCFGPRPDGAIGLGLEVAAAVASRECRLVITSVVAAELQEVVSERFAAASAIVATFLAVNRVVTLPHPAAELAAAAAAACVDPDDAPIAASAVQCVQRFGAELLLTNDIENFHTDAMKDFLAGHGLVPVTLYGLLRLLGRR